MTTGQRDQENCVSDDAVSACYRDNESELPPAWLDDRVMQHARAAANSKRFAGTFFSLWRFSFWRPVTFVATLGISLMIVLQVNDAWVFGTVATENAQSAAGELADVVEGSARRLREQANSATDGLNLGSANPPSPATNSDTAAAISSAMPTPARHCEIAEAKSANDWWQCILQLEHDGRTADADAERERISVAFPTFQPPE